jgi:hypothetical protein
MNPKLLQKYMVDGAVHQHDACTSQVKSLITNYALYIVRRATAHSKTGSFRDYGVAEAPPGFQAGWSDCMNRSLHVKITTRNQKNAFCIVQTDRARFTSPL